ncbi:hypothetical protein SMICM304S_07909 [Streptomyces microflavus]
MPLVEFSAPLRVVPSVSARPSTGSSTAPTSHGAPGVQLNVIVQLFSPISSL